MTTETMNVHKALSELKVIDDRIRDAINQNFVDVKKHSADNIRGMSVQQVTEYMISAYQKANDLITRRNAIKRAVVLSNATTKVTIAGKEYTIAEAIDMKNHGLDGLRELRDRLSLQFRNCSMKADRDNEQLENIRADAYIKDTFGNTDMSKAGDDAKKARKDFVTAQTVELVDPLGVLKKIEELDERINAFMVEVDSALSVSNATTEITIEY